MRSMFLDSTPLSMLARVLGQAGWHWRAGIELNVAEEVMHETLAGQSVGELLAGQWDGGTPWVARHSLVVGTPAQRLYTEVLRPRSASATTNAGEDASIALLATEFPDGVFVTVDGKASLSALIELGPPRVTTPFDCWAAMSDAGCIDRTLRLRLDEMTSKHLQRARPQRLTDFDGG